MANRKFENRKAIILCLSIGLLAAGLSVFIQTQTLTAYGFQTQSQNPVRLIIPAIGVNANIQDVGLSWRNDGSLGVPSNFTDVAWYKDGPAPGMTGDSIIDGHVDGKYVEKAVFYNIANLKPGDLVLVATKDEKTLYFIVTGTKIYDYQSSTTDVFLSSDSKAHLNLITCTGNWIKNHSMYDKRIVVFTDLVTN